jgi:hypothetical protein
MNNPGQMVLLFALGSIALDCNGQTQTQDPYRPIPEWVRIDQSLLSEKPPGQKLADPQISSIVHNLAEPPHLEASPFHPPQSSRIPMAEAYRMQERPFNAAMPRQAESSPASYRPSLEIPGGWKVSMPNAKRSVARLLLQHSF